VVGGIRGMKSGRVGVGVGGGLGGGGGLEVGGGGEV